MVAGDLREGLNRLWLVLVLGAFCLPLFVGLGATDLENDEAIYAFAVESILTTGDWLSPRSSPNIEIPFLEKPPLKFWIVAAPIAAGVLPLNEFGLRFWDAVFGAASFTYLFLLGRRLAGPLCGASAVLVLWAHEPLLFDHGLRSNNMDAALLLAYCGGVFHYLRWGSAASVRARRGHVLAVAAFFYVGFMMKFVAALFLPLVLGVSVLASRHHRRQLALDWRMWTGAAALVVAAVLPWFVYQHLRNGDVLWRVMFGEHVYTRLTSFADPRHVNPWYYYAARTVAELADGHSAPWVIGGLALLVVSVIRRHAAYEGIVLLVWLLLPLTLISFGSSKLYHYAYPFLPPLGLAAGFGVAWLVEQMERLWLRMRGDRAAPPSRIPPAIRLAAVVLIAAALGMAVATAVVGTLRLQVGGEVLFRNTSWVRPLGFALLMLPVIGGARAAVGALMVLLLAVLTPSPLRGYVDNLERLDDRRQRLRSVRDCLARVEAARRAAGDAPSPVYAPVSEAGFLHPQFYYLRGDGWHEPVDADRLASALFDPARQRPVVIENARYAEFLERQTGNEMPAAVNDINVMILLPGPYAACSGTRR